MNWLQKEWQAIKASKTIKMSYLKVIAGIVSVLLAVSGYFEGSIDPMWFGVGVTILGMADNKLRKLTRKPLDEK